VSDVTGLIHAVDKWTVAHLLVGLGLSIFRVPRPVAYAIIIGTEVVEFALRRTDFSQTLFAETQENIVADIFFSVLSYEVNQIIGGDLK